MERAPRTGRAGEPAAASSSKLRLFLIIAVAITCLLAVGTTSLGAQVAAFAARNVGNLAVGRAGGVALLGVALVAMVASAFFLLRRRAKSSNAPLRRAFRDRAAAAERDPDPAVQALGRGVFLAQLQGKISMHAEEGRQLALHRLDLDRFRDVNARFGRDAGDKVLTEVSRRLAELAGDPVNLGRLGDDEFAIIQPEAGGAKHAEIFAARIQKALEEPVVIGAAEIRVTASIGIAVAPEHGAEAERLLASADMALEKAQQVGSGSVRCFAAAMDERLARRGAVEEALRAALKEGDSGRLELRYQPQWDLGSRRLAGFEVQARLRDPGLGTVQEAELVSAADAAGLLTALSERLAREVCRTASRWPQHLRIAFNLYAGHCRSRDMAKLLGEALKANHLSPGRVDLEVAEEVVTSGGVQAAELLRRFAEMGFRLVLDGYGSDHSGPADLWRGAFAAIKIDPGLVCRIGQGDGVEALVGAMIRLAESLQVEPMADGAERVEQLHFLMLNGCRRVAGPVLGPAVAADKLAAIIDKDAKSAEGGAPASRAAA